MESTAVAVDPAEVVAVDTAVAGRTGGAGVAGPRDAAVAERVRQRFGQQSRFGQLPRFRVRR
ncbi:hypothetical protein BST21_23055 [Mycolicibacterium celeriflavum]|nr:hypothetical protein BST21_23055 [Mycolicibacterium celeriflavum]